MFGLLRPMAAAALAGALVITTPCSVEAAAEAASAVPSAAAAGVELAPTPVGRATSSGSPVAGRTVRAQVVVNVSCRAAEAFSRTGDGALYRLVDSAPSSNTADTMTETSQVGSGWSGSSMAWTASGGTGCCTR